MSIYRITGAFRLLACSLLICAAVVHGPRTSFAQTTDSSGERRPDAEPPSGTVGVSQQAPENQQQPHAQEAAKDPGCSIRGFSHETWTEASQFGHGLKAVPRGAVRPSNLKWELPILAATGVLIAKVDRPADNRIQSISLQQTAGRWSNIGLGLELGSAALAYGIGCGKHHSYLRDTGFKALAAMGAAGTADLALKLAFDRQFPYFLTRRTARESSGAGEGPFRPGIQPQVLHLRRWSLIDIPRINGSSGEHMRLQRESVSRATQRRSTTPRTSS